MLACPPQFRKTNIMSQHKTIPLLAALVLALLGLLFAGYWYLHGRYFESTDNVNCQRELDLTDSRMKPPFLI